ncbi:Uncharacterised protein [uncultured archaeon]|nr:Uncharacterised protein [uncultured archaeon]
MEGKRVVVTGMGAFTPLGLNVKDLFENSRAGKSVIRDVSSEIPVMVRINGDNEIPILKTNGSYIGSLFYPEQINHERFGKESKRRMCHDTRIASAAAKEAIEDSGIFYNPATTEQIKERTGVSIGSGFGGISDIEKAVIKVCREGLLEIDDFIAFKTLPGAPAAYIAANHQLHAGDGPSVCTECSSGNSNIMNGCMNIQLGLADTMICGGTGDAFSFLTHGGFSKLRATSYRNDDPSHASRPFDRDRNGFVIGDGAGVVILEELEHAKKRGANIYAEIKGYGAKLDGDHPTSPRSDAKYATLAIKQSLEMARLNPEDINHINAHGTSTKFNDWQETLAIKQSFGEYAKNITISSDKSRLGHTLNASGGLELIISIMSMKNSVIPPTINLDNPDTQKDYHDERLQKYFVPCDLDYVPNKARDRKINNFISSSFGFGGRSVVLCCGRYEN